MKGRCVAGTDSGYYFEFTGEQPKEGVEYLLEDATHGTQAQNKAFHGLLNNFWQWMNKTDTFIFQDGNRIFDLSTPSASDFREFFKYKYGAGASHYQYIDDYLRMKKADNLEDIPTHVLRGEINPGNPVLQKMIDNIEAMKEKYPELDEMEMRESFYRPIHQLYNNEHRIGKNDRIKAVLKSWSKYTKKQRQNTIDNLLMIISLSGCDSPKVREIIEGMEK